MDKDSVGATIDQYSDSTNGGDDDTIDRITFPFIFSLYENQKSLFNLCNRPYRKMDMIMFCVRA